MSGFFKGLLCGVFGGNHSRQLEVAKPASLLPWRDTCLRGLRVLAFSELINSWLLDTVM